MLDTLVIDCSVLFVRVPTCSCEQVMQYGTYDRHLKMKPTGKYLSLRVMTEVEMGSLG